MWQYIKSKEFRYTVLGLILFGILSFILLFFLFLPIFTKHGDTVMVPEMHKMKLEEAKNILEMADLQYEVSDSIYNPIMEPYTVYISDPPALSKVKPGRRIYLTINQASPPMVGFPDKVIEVSDYQAKLTLKRWGFDINKILYEPNEFKDLVLKVLYDGEPIKAGELIPKGARVDLVVGKGLGNQKVEIPDLTGMRYESAIAKIHEVGLNIGSLNFKPKSKKEKGTVIDQSPRADEGDSTKVGSSVTLSIAGDRPEEAQENTD